MAASAASASVQEVVPPTEIQPGTSRHDGKYAAPVPPTPPKVSTITPGLQKGFLGSPPQHGSMSKLSCSSKPAHVGEAVSACSSARAAAPYAVQGPRAASAPAVSRRQQIDALDYAADPIFWRGGLVPNFHGGVRGDVGFRLPKGQADGLYHLRGRERAELPVPIGLPSNCTVKYQNSFLSLGESSSRGPLDEIEPKPSLGSLQAAMGGQGLKLCTYYNQNPKRDTCRNGYLCKFRHENLSTGRGWEQRERQRRQSTAKAKTGALDPTYCSATYCSATMFTSRAGFLELCCPTVVSQAYTVLKDFAGFVNTSVYVAQDLYATSSSFAQASKADRFPTAHHIGQEPRPHGAQGPPCGAVHCPHRHCLTSTYRMWEKCGVCSHAETDQMWTCTLCGFFMCRICYEYIEERLRPVDTDAWHLPALDDGFEFPPPAAPPPEVPQWCPPSKPRMPEPPSQLPPPADWIAPSPPPPLQLPPCPKEPQEPAAPEFGNVRQRLATVMCSCACLSTFTVCGGLLMVFVALWGLIDMLLCEGRRRQETAWREEVARIRAAHGQHLQRWNTVVESQQALHERQVESWQRRVEALEQAHERSMKRWREEVERRANQHQKRMAMYRQSLQQWFRNTADARRSHEAKVQDYQRAIESHLEQARKHSLRKEARLRQWQADSKSREAARVKFVERVFGGTLGRIIKFPRKAYEHFGIGDGQGYIVHLTDDRVVRRDRIASVADFDQRWEVVDDRVYSRYTAGSRRYTDAEVLQRAVLRHEKPTDSYSITRYNCEHFATEMRFGEMISLQRERALDAVRLFERRMLGTSFITSMLGTTELGQGVIDTLLPVVACQGSRLCDGQASLPHVTTSVKDRRATSCR